jgi:hypothetical protein
MSLYWGGLGAVLLTLLVIIIVDQMKRSRGRRQHRENTPAGQRAICSVLT